MKQRLQGGHLGNHLPSFIPVGRSPAAQVLDTPPCFLRTGRTFRQQPRNALNISPLGPRLQNDVSTDSSSSFTLGLQPGVSTPQTRASHSAPLTSLFLAVKDVSRVKAGLSAVRLPFQLEVLRTSRQRDLVLCAVGRSCNRNVTSRCFYHENLLANEKLSCLSEKKK